MELKDRSHNGSMASVDEMGHESIMSNDARDLMRVGKKPVLKRNFGFMSILGFSCTVLITWEGMLIVSTSGLLNGGPAGVIWGYLIVWMGTLSTFTTLSELASMAPTAGGQYHWVAMLSPPRCSKFLSYITGWMTAAGWQAVCASACYLIGTLIQSVIVVTTPDYIPKPWQAMLLFWAVLAFAVFINTVASKTLAHFEGVILILHIFGFIGIIVPLVYLGPHGDNSLFYTFVNGGNWSTQGLSFMVGLPAGVFSLIGADSAVHMAEEIKNASVVVPRAILISIVLNGILGFAMMLAYLFCLGDVTTALNEGLNYGYTFVYVFYNATGSRGGAAAMSLIIVVLGTCSTVGVLASSSRQLWSFARDRGVPGWQILTKLDSRTSIPIYTVAITTFISMLLSLIILGSSVAFNNIVNLSIAGLYASYFLSAVLLLWRRLQSGAIRPHSSDPTLVGPGNLSWGPWRIPGFIGTLNNLFTCCYLALLWFWAFWPPATPVTPQTMNFSCLVFGFVTLFATVWYFIVGKRTYDGPIVEINL